MKGILQYCDTVDGTYLNCGTIRTKNNQDYSVEAITMNDREDNIITIGYKITVNAKALELDASFRDEEQWYFRILFPSPGAVTPPVPDMIINLGLKSYNLDYDSLLQRHDIEYHIIKITFTIATDNFIYYAIPEEV